MEITKSARNRTLPDWAKWATERAISAKDKPAKHGPDVDLARFIAPSEKPEVESLESLSRQIREAALYAGVETEAPNRSGTYFQVDHSVIYKKVAEAFEGKLEIMSIEDALERYPWMEEYWWKAVQVDTDKFTALAELHRTHGYFIRVLPHQKLDKPIQSCLLVSENHISQNVHNVIIMEEGSQAEVITGCTLMPKVNDGLHAGISEFFIKRGATLSFTMIHNWAEGFHVRPRTVAVLDEGATFVSNYVMMHPVRSIQTYPTAILRGDGSRAEFNTIIYARSDSIIDVGSRVMFYGRGTRAESVSRAVAADNAVAYLRGSLISHQDESVGHLDCRGILFSKDARMEAIPELASVGAKGSNLSHEAAIGPIAEEAVEYLMARGLSRDQAVATITRGFLNIDLPGLPPVVRHQIDEVLAATVAHAM